MWEVIKHRRAKERLVGGERTRREQQRRRQLRYGMGLYIAPFGPFQVEKLLRASDLPNWRKTRRKARFPPKQCGTTGM